LSRPVQSEVSIVFADIVSSTSLFELLGETNARETINYCLQIMRRAVLDHNGTVIKTIGDELLSTFPDPDRAVDAAQQMHENITETLIIKGRSVTLRIGAHHGTVIHEKNDISGASVHLAARMSSQAKTGQIVLSGLMRETLSPIWKSTTRKIDETKVDGFSEAVELYEVLWKDEGVTSVVPMLKLEDFEKITQKRLKVTFGEQEFFIDKMDDFMNIGRASDNELCINHDLVSRVHARIEFHKDKFRVQDKSTNGTYVRPLSGQPIFVRRDYYTLTGRGIIGLGQDVNIKSPYAIRYEVLD